MDALSKSIIVAAAILGAAHFFPRLHTVSSNSAPVIYVINTMTGSVKFCNLQGCRALDDN